MYKSVSQNKKLHRPYCNLQSTEYFEVFVQFFSPFYLFSFHTCSFMYWTDWSEGVGTTQQARIERAFMDGTNRTEFVSAGLQWPNGLSLDKDREVLYWCDAFHDTISRKYLNGTGSVVSGIHIKNVTLHHKTTKVTIHVYELLVQDWF